MQVYSWQNLTEERINEKVARKMFWGENIMVVKWELAPGTTLPTHDHVSEQVTIVHKGSTTLSFPGEADVTLRDGDMLVIPPSKPHSVTVGPDGCVVTDLFSPIRHDFIKRTESYLPQSGDKARGQPREEQAKPDQEEAYRALYSVLRAKGIKASLEDVQQMPLELVARFAYERECLSMGQIRRILGIDKEQAKTLIRQWKHGDDHSESSLKRKMERLVMLQGEDLPRSRRF